MAETASLRDNAFIKGHKTKARNPNAPKPTNSNSSSNVSTSAGKKYSSFGNLESNDMDKIRQLVNQQPAADRIGFAYDTALDLARRDQENERRTRGFTAFNQEADLTAKADKHLKEILGDDSVTGKQIRGENLFTQALGGLREGINGFNNMVGTGLDWGVDRFGDLVGLVSGRDDWRQGIQDATTGETLSIIPEIAEDLGIIALTGPVGAAGILGAKGLIQNSDDLQEAFTGIDHITGEQLTGGQRLANAAAGLGGTALTMLPGMSAAKAGTKLIGNELKAGVDTAEKGLAKVAGKGKEYEKALRKAQANSPSKQLDRAVSEAQTARNQELGNLSQPTMADIMKNPEAAAQYAGARDQAIGTYKKAIDNAWKAFNGRTNNLRDLRKGAAKEKATKAELDEAKALQEAFDKIAPTAGEDGKIPLRELIRFATRNPFSQEARQYNQLARDAYRRNFSNALNADLGKTAAEGEEVKGSVPKAIWNILTGRTFAKGANWDEKAIVDAIKNGGKKAGDDAADAAADAAKKTAKSRLSPASIFKNTNGEQGRGMVGLEGPGGIMGLGLTAGSGLAESMANTPGGVQAAVNNLADQIGQGSDAQLLPLALAMLPGPRRAVSRMFAGRTLPYYSAKARLAQEGVNNVNYPNWSDEDEDALYAALGGKKMASKEKI